jgi:hypothetical protein
MKLEQEPHKRTVTAARGEQVRAMLSPAFGNPDCGETPRGIGVQSRDDFIGGQGMPGFNGWLGRSAYGWHGSWKGFQEGIK